MLAVTDGSRRAYLYTAAGAAWALTPPSIEAVRAATVGVALPRMSLRDVVQAALVGVLC